MAFVGRAHHEGVNMAPINALLIVQLVGQSVDRFDFVLLFFFFFYLRIYLFIYVYSLHFRTYCRWLIMDSARPFAVYVSACLTANDCHDLWSVCTKQQAKKNRLYFTKRINFRM